ncbi:MAG: bifunctional pyr operon transcriptional regulator/uracil phosphoribosyltransferase PyrR, partial [Flavobacteriales bacterium]|nr:bifunctional pyr operon transcriptional regulator/uracil phosphoribosyltransferase PyrR [Flavobacteriales bacterium]
MQPLLLMDASHMSLVVDRLCHQLIENHDRFSGSAIIGLQPRGIHLASRLVSHLSELLPGVNVKNGLLDITFFRDDFRRTGKPLLARDTTIDFSIEGMNIILVDDVLYTGRSIRAGMEALLEFGRPNKVELMVFIDRRFSRQ